MNNKAENGEDRSSDNARSLTEEENVVFRLTAGGYRDGLGKTDWARSKYWGHDTNVENCAWLKDLMRLVKKAGSVLTN